MVIKQNYIQFFQSYRFFFGTIMLRGMKFTLTFSTKEAQNEVFCPGVLKLFLQGTLITKINYFWHH